jgi:hypothetical protein
MANRDAADDLPQETQKPFCPNCGSTDIRGSQTHHMLDFLLKSFSLKPYRCRSCRKRFYRRQPPEPEVDVDDDGSVEHKDAADSNVNP